MEQLGIILLLFVVGLIIEVVINKRTAAAALEGVSFVLPYVWGRLHSLCSSSSVRQPLVDLPRIGWPTSSLPGSWGCRMKMRPCSRRSPVWRLPAW